MNAPPASETTGLRRILRWLGTHELGTLVVFGTLAGSALFFIELASEVSEGDVDSVDRTLLLALRNPDNIADPLGPPWLEEMGRDMSALGGVAVLTLATLGVVGYLVLARRRRAALFVAVAVMGGALVSGTLKHLYERPRPTLVPHLSYVTSTSFPSGHSMLAAAVYLTIGALLARTEKSLVLKAYLLTGSVAVIVLVGVSRVYLGVHWPSDVVGGWAAGAGWACLCWLGARWLQRRGHFDHNGG